MARINRAPHDGPAGCRQLHRQKHVDPLPRRVAVYGIEGDVGLSRQFLHAARLAFPHPFTGAPVEAESPLPEDLREALERAREGGSAPVRNS